MKTDWTDVREKLPPEGEEVIVSIKDETGDTSYDYTTAGWYSGQGYKFVVDNEYNSWVTHWMPRPKPFKKTDDNWLIDSIKEIIEENKKLRTALNDCRSNLCSRCGGYKDSTLACDNCNWNVDNMLQILSYKK